MAAQSFYGQAIVVQQEPLGVQEASAVAPLGGGRFLVVDDEAGVFRCAVGEQPVALEAGGGLRDLEGACIAPGGLSAYLLSERDGSLWRFTLEGDDLGEGERVGRLPRLSKKKNQGWEGIAIAPVGLWNERDELVAVHQTKPRTVAVIDLETLEPRLLARLPKAARKALGDLNDVTVDLRHGHILVLSGKAGRIAQLAFDGDELQLVRLYKIESGRNDVPEGMSMDGDGRLWLVTDGGGWLREYSLSA
jgi:uncharacterized protein YjiK